MQATTATPRTWPEGGITRVPAWIYSDEEIFRKELTTFFSGDTWSFVGLECEIPDVGSFKRAWMGDKQVIVVRDEDGINVVENRCAHRGGAICWKNSGEVKDLTCVYHQWNYSLKGELRGIPLKRGVHGAGGMPEDFDASKHNLRRLRVTVRGGAVWASFSNTVPEFADYCGPELLKRLDRLLSGRPLRMLGVSRQLIPSNWKLYFENTRDPYHGTLLHTFFITFGLYRADSKHITSPTESGKHSCNYAVPGDRSKGEDITNELTRFRGDLQLNDMETVRYFDEYGDGEMSAMQVFPSVFVQQHANILAMRSIVPKSTREVEVIWTYFGYADDDEHLQRIRLKQSNLLGPSGFVSMDDSELLKQMQNQVAGYPGSVGVVEMGGHGTETQVTMATEVGIRAFYDYYRREMSL
ncbi:aromatic ring-hydroxylating oxygenase subunit alpha [Paraburkholderia aspalathi]|nr:SRPBCC family protein [Paraburkholderia aspalathi]